MSQGTNGPLGLLGCIGEAIDTARALGWRYLLDRQILWSLWPIRCVACRGWFLQGDFLNPWGPGKGPGLACSEACCEMANPGSTQG